jgi:hypothetical protein
MAPGGDKDIGHARVGGEKASLPPDGSSRGKPGRKNRLCIEPLFIGFGLKQIEGEQIYRDRDVADPLTT